MAKDLVKIIKMSIQGKVNELTLIKAELKNLRVRSSGLRKRVKEIEEDQNTSLAILFGSVFIGLAIVIAAAIS